MFWNMNQRWSAKERAGGGSATSVERLRSATATRLTGNLERREVLQVLAIDSATSKHVHDIVDERGGVPLARDGNVADAAQLDPNARVGIVAPRIVVVVLAVRAAESVVEGESELETPTKRRRWGGHEHIDAVAVSDGGVTGTLRRYNSSRRVVDESPLGRARLDCRVAKSKGQRWLDASRRAIKTIPRTHASASRTRLDHS